jgi:hypothetical protein
VSAGHRPQARPVPGYAAPPDTIEAATRATEVFAAVLRDAARAAALTDPPAGDLPAEVAGDLEAIGSGLFEGVPAQVVARAVVAWTGVFGLVSFELFRPVPERHRPPPGVLRPRRRRPRPHRGARRLKHVPSVMCHADAAPAVAAPVTPQG